VLEPDLRKPLAAAGLRRTEPRLRSVAGYVDSIDGTFDAVAILDVLYRLPNAAWDGLLAAVLARLAPGGTLLLKEIDPTARGKAAWNRLQERAVDLVGLTLGEAHSYEAPARMRERLLGVGFDSVEVIDLGRAYPHAHVLYVARRG